MADSISVEDFSRLLAQPGSFVLVDIRRQSDFEADDVVIPGARRGDPDAVESWAAALPPDVEIIVYCVRGGLVSQSVTPQLRARGLPARYIAGGITAWKALGGRLELREAVGPDS